MRITGGTWSSRRLRGPSRGMPLRPTPDAMRERAFAVLAESVAGVTMLDLYAGTGAVGFEALSRGAARVVFVERHRAAARLIAANRAALGVAADRAALLVRPVHRALDELVRRGESFQLAWADPPFEIWGEGLEALARAFRSGILSGDAVACLECPQEATVAIPSPLEVTRELSGGASRLVMLRADPEHAGA